MVVRRSDHAAHRDRCGWSRSSVLFSWYLSNFANYNATYGSLGAVIGFMVWTWISVVILLAGAELNAEMEHQTSCDTTTGEPRPMGMRGAAMADTLGRSSAEGSAERPHALDASSELTRRPDEVRDEEQGAPQPSRLGTVLGFAIPAGLLAGATVREVLGRRKARGRQKQIGRAHV